MLEYFKNFKFCAVKILTEVQWHGWPNTILAENKEEFSASQK